MTDDIAAGLAAENQRLRHEVMVLRAALDDQRDRARGLGEAAAFLEKQVALQRFVFFHHGETAGYYVFGDVEPQEDGTLLQRARPVLEHKP